MLEYPLSLRIGGEAISSGRDVMPVMNPATEQRIGDLPITTEEDLDRALELAKTGFDIWRRTAAHERAAILHRAAAIVRDRSEQIAAAASAELGSPVAASRFEALVAADVLDWSAGEARRIYGRVIPARFPGVTQIARKDPIGPVFAACPWNMPIIFPTRKMAEALAAGCSVILKPAEETPTPALMVYDALVEAGLPKEIVSVVYGNPAMISRKLLGSGIIRKLTFTGSIPVGKLLSELASQRMVKTTMELGGHAPTIVFDDVNIEPVARLLAARKARNSGQVCNSPTRFYVHKNIYKPFTTAFAQALDAIKIGNPEDPATEMGPVVNGKRMAAIEGLIADAKAAGATIATGGERLGNKGFFHKLTLINDVPNEARVMSEEPFGPLAAVQPFETIDDVLERANALPFGLAAYVFSASRRNLDAMANDLEVGLLGLNHCDIAAAETPFGGMKESGFGSEGGSEGIEGFLTTRFVTESPPAEN